MPTGRTSCSCPHSASRRAGAAALAKQIPESRLVAPERIEAARREIVGADAAFGILSPDLLAAARTHRLALLGHGRSKPGEPQERPAAQSGPQPAAFSRYL